MKKKALILGITGQDGSYLSKFLINKGYEVHGTSRDLKKNKLKNLLYLNVSKNISMHVLNPQDMTSILSLINKIQPDEIYNLSGQSSVSTSFLEPRDTFYSIAHVSLNILEALKVSKNQCKFYNASSSECFGNTGNLPSNEKTKFNPCSPYGVAKSSAFWLTKNYRKNYNLFACSGILFNHESHLRPYNFVTKKIIRTAVEIYFGKKNNLYLGDISIERDWGWAPDYIEAMWLILQNDYADDFVISTGVLTSLETFVENVFANLKLNWKDHTTICPKLVRVSELKKSFGNSKKAKSILGWQAQNKVSDVIDNMLNIEIEEYQNRKKK
jgi:GDPmannose 4,6-dehydratase